MLLWNIFENYNRNMPPLCMSKDLQVSRVWNLWYFFFIPGTNYGYFEVYKVRQEGCKLPVQKTFLQRGGRGQISGWPEKQPGRSEASPWRQSKVKLLRRFLYDSLSCLVSVKCYVFRFYHNGLTKLSSRSGSRLNVA